MRKIQISKFNIQAKIKNQIFNLKIDHWNLFGLCALIIGIFCFASPVSATTIYSQAANQDVYVGQTFVVDWYLDTENANINALDLTLDFSPDTLEVSDISSGNSLINLWIVQPTSDNASGTIKLTGGVAGGIVGDKIPIFRATFHAKKEGIATLALDPASQILLNDGAGTSETLKFRNEVFNVYPAGFVPLTVSSATHPDQTAWYQSNNVKLRFDPKADTQYAVSFSSNPEIFPDSTAVAVPTEFSYQNLPDGIYYFKVNSKQGANAWQEAAVYRVQIDRTAPEEFTPILGSEAGKSFLSFSTLDKTSGISHYKVKVGWFGGTETKDTQYILPRWTIGKNISITAYDNAGNQRTETIKYDAGISPAWAYGIICLIILSLVWYFRKHFLKRFRKPKNENQIEN